MKVAFWSNTGGQCRVTANMAAISLACVTRYPYSIISLENKLCQNNLGRAYIGNTGGNLLYEVGTNYYDGGGMEGLMRKIYRGEYHSGTLETYLRVILQEHLFYIPQSRVIHNEIFDYEFDRSIHQLFRMIEENADICFIDTACNKNLSTKTILEEADLIAVNLCQKQNILEDFFLNYSSLIPKAVFIISNYHNHSLLSSRRISRMFDIPLENMIMIPNNEMFHNAYQNGNVREFMKGNYHCSKESPNYQFIQSIKKASYLVVKKAEQMVKQKEQMLKQKELNLCGRS